MPRRLGAGKVLFDTLPKKSVAPAVVNQQRLAFRVKARLNGIGEVRLVELGGRFIACSRKS